MNTAIGSYKLVVAYQICMTILILLHCTALDVVTFIKEFESVQNHRNSSDVHHN